MTNEEATEWLETMKKGLFPWSDEVMNEICDTAINALSAPKRKTGEWLKIYPDHEEWNVYECSHCGEEFDLIEGTPYDNGYNFCPNCGADMRGGNE